MREQQVVVGDDCKSVLLLGYSRQCPHPNPPGPNPPLFLDTVAGIESIFLRNEFVEIGNQEVTSAKSKTSSLSCVDFSLTMAIAD
jgi:hypothetical protein